MLEIQNLLKQSEIKNLYQRIKSKRDQVSNFSRKKLVFEKERCQQILNRNIPMCISMHIKNILQSTSKDKIIGQLHRLNLECYWKILNLEYLNEINKQLNKIE